jgi:excisionase family DNA binding protein
MPTGYITTAEAAQQTGYTEAYIRELITGGKVDAKKYGRSWMVSRASLLAHKRKAEKMGAKRGRKSAS